MKTLELNQMELVEGGSALQDCGVATGVAIAGAMILGLSGGPFTWWTVATVYLMATSWVYDCRNV